MPKLDAISLAACHLQEAKESRRIPKDLHEDLETLLGFVRRRISISNATSDISDEIKSLMSIRTKINLRESHITTLDALCSLSEDELTGIFKKHQIKNIPYSIQLIRQELNRHGIAHRLGPGNVWEG